MLQGYPLDRYGEPCRSPINALEATMYYGREFQALAINHIIGGSWWFKQGSSIR